METIPKLSKIPLTQFKYNNNSIGNIIEVICRQDSIYTLLEKIYKSNYQHVQNWYEFADKCLNNKCKGRIAREFEG